MRLPPALAPRQPVVPIIFYRSALLAADTAPIDALCEALAARGLAPAPLVIPSLKDPKPARSCAARFSDLPRRSSSPPRPSPPAARARLRALDGVDAPVLQVVIATTRRAAWQESPRGLGPADLAMHVVLPELDGRMLAGAIAFKDALPSDDALAFTAYASRPEPDRVAIVADRIAALVRLRRTPRAERQDRRADAGLSRRRRPHRLTPSASTCRPASSPCSRDLAEAGYRVTVRRKARRSCSAAVEAGATEVGLSLRRLSPPARRASSRSRDARSHAAWGEPEADADVRDGAFRFRAAQFGNLLVALPPDRGRVADRRAAYHDPTLPPRHALLAFGLWLRHAAKRRRHRAYGRARHARMAARQGRGADGRVLPRGGRRPAAGVLSVPRQQSGRSGAGQAPHRRHDHRPSAAAAGACRARRPGAGARAAGRRIRHRRWARPAAARASGAADRRDRAAHRSRPRGRRRRATTPTRRCARSMPGCAT